jgi:hypothetical protein
MDVRPKTSAVLGQALLLLFVLIVVGIVLTKAPTTSGRAGAQEAPQSQQPDRLVVRKPWPVEPVKVVAVKTKSQANIETGRPFDADDDWLDGFTVTVVNNSNKVVTAMEIEMVFRREPGNTRPPLAYALHFGPNPSAREYIYRDPKKVIEVGKTAELSLSPEEYKSLKHDFEQAGYPNGIKRVELVIREVGFEDGSMLHTGTFYVQDPANPNDPTKKLPVPGPLGGRNQKLRSPPNSKDSPSGLSFLKASLTLPNPLQDEDCRAKLYQPRHWCDNVLTCSLSRDVLEPFESGNYSTELFCCTARNG